MLVPCYDDGATFRESVDSIVEDEEIEIVAIDDGSRDPHTIAELDDLAASGAVRLVRQANAGVSAALRAGAAAATSPYVFILNSDDLAEPGALGALADALDADPAADFAFGWIHFFGDVDFVAQQPAWNPWILLYSNRWAISSLYRRDALDAVGRRARRHGVRGLGSAARARRAGSARRARAAGRAALPPARRRSPQPGGPGRPAQAVRGAARPARAALRARARAPPRYPLPFRTRLGYRVQLQAGLLLPRSLVPRLLALKLRTRQALGR